MKRFNFTYVCLLSVILTLLALPLFGEDSLDESAKGSTLILPFARYSNDTGILAGLIGNLNRYGVLDKGDAILLSTSLQYSQKKQGVANLSVDYHTRNNELKSFIDFGYKHWPDSFYGIGIESKRSDREEYISKKFEILGGVSKKILSEWSLGVHLDYGDYQLEAEENTLFLDEGSIVGVDGGRVFGFGLTMSKDTRNSYFFATEGEYWELGASFFEDTLVGDYQFSNYVVDYRKYLPLKKGHSVAIQAFLGSQTNGVPFQRMYQLGNYLRGYNRSRFINSKVNAFRAEYRLFPFSGEFGSRVGLVLFPELGTVFSTVDDWELKNYKLSFGMGIRFRALEGDSPLLRIDFGITPESTNLIIISTEAF